VAPGQYKPTNYEPTITLYAKWEDNPIAGNKRWSSIAMSSDGTKLAAMVGGPSSDSRHIYDTLSSGAIGQDRSTATGSGISENKNWISIAMSSDGRKLAAVAWNSHHYTSSNEGTTWKDRSR